MYINMGKTMSELLANSFVVGAYVTESGVIVLPDRILNVMGRELKGDYCHDSSSYVLVSKIGDEYFKGEPLTLIDQCLSLPEWMVRRLCLSSGGVLICSYNGVGDYFFMKKDE